MMAAGSAAADKLSSNIDLARTALSNATSHSPSSAARFVRNPLSSPTLIQTPTRQGLGIAQVSGEQHSPQYLAFKRGASSAGQGLADSELELALPSSAAAGPNATPYTTKLMQTNIASRLHTYDKHLHEVYARTYVCIQARTPIPERSQLVVPENSLRVWTRTLRMI
jgi:hypothetical protein